MAISHSYAEPSDLESVAELLVEMDEFYGEQELESVETKIRNMGVTLFGENPSASLLLAWDDQGSSVIGIAAYSYLWPAVGTTRSLYLKELYVRKSHRRHGVGRLLMEQLFEVARNNSCSRVEWTTDHGNAEAQGFYQSMNVNPNTNKIFYRLEL